MLKVGLTGGIGSGKTTVAKVLQALNVPVYIADKEAKRLLNESPFIKTEIIRLFGKELYEAGVLDRKLLAKIIFNDAKSLEKVNQLVHPEVRKDFFLWTQSQVGTKYVVQESALLFETDLYQSFELKISVITPKEERLQRVLNRDNMTREAIEKRMAAQTTDEVRLAKSDFILHNGERDYLLKQVLEVHEKIQNIKK